VVGSGGGWWWGVVGRGGGRWWGGVGVGGGGEGGGEGVGGGVEREGSNESSGVFVWHTVTTNHLWLRTKKGSKNLTGKVYNRPSECLCVCEREREKEKERVLAKRVFVYTQICIYLCMWVRVLNE